MGTPGEAQTSLNRVVETFCLRILLCLTFLRFEKKGL